MNELQKYALTLATKEELKEAIYINIHGHNYTYEMLFPNGIISHVEVEEIECQPIKN